MAIIILYLYKGYKQNKSDEHILSVLKVKGW